MQNLILLYNKMTASLHFNLQISAKQLKSLVEPAHGLMKNAKIIATQTRLKQTWPKPKDPFRLGVPFSRRHIPL